VFCLPAGRLSVTPSGTFHAISPVLTLTATSSPHGGCWHIMFDALSLNRPAGPLPRYGPVRPPRRVGPTKGSGFTGPLVGSLVAFNWPRAFTLTQREPRDRIK